MKKAGLCLALAAALVLVGCARQAAAGASSGSDAASQAGRGASAASAQAPGGDAYAHEADMLALVNQTLSEYAAGTLPEPMRYNTDYSGITNSPPLETALPQSVSLAQLTYELYFAEITGTETLVANLVLENDYTMDIHMDTGGADGAGAPTRVLDVYFYDRQGSGQAESATATRGGDFLNLKSDRLFASADFEEVRTDAGRVSGSISWGKANHFLWIDVDSMKEPFFYTYFVTGEGALVQDYPQKDWQRYEVIHDDKMMTIAQSLYDQFRSALGSSGLLL